MSEPVWRGCNCAFGPRCGSQFWCEDANQTLGIKCRRLGVIRARAAWAVFLPGRQPPAVRTPPRPHFYCNECWEAHKEALSKPIVGLDPPKGASDFWRPSIVEMVRHAAMEINRQDRVKIPENYTDAVIQFQMELMRRRGFRRQERRA